MPNKNCFVESINQSPSASEQCTIYKLAFQGVVTKICSENHQQLEPDPLRLRAWAELPGTDPSVPQPNLWLCFFTGVHNLHQS